MVTTVDPEPVAEVTVPAVPEFFDPRTIPMSSTPIVGENNNYKPAYIVAICLGIVSDGIGIWGNFKSNFYYYNLG